MELGFTDQYGWDAPDYDSTAFVGDRWRCAGQSEWRLAHVLHLLQLSLEREFPSKLWRR